MRGHIWVKTQGVPPGGTNAQEFPRDCSTEAREARGETDEARLVPQHRDRDAYSQCVWGAKTRLSP